MPDRIASQSPEARLGVGVAMGTVLAGAVGFALIAPSSNEEPQVKGPIAQAQVEKAHRSVAIGEKPEGYAVPIRKVEPSEAIRLALEQVGVKEGPDRQTKYHDWFVSTPNAKMTAKRDGGFSVDAYNGAEWCNMFVSWVGAQLGVKDMGWDAYTVQHAKWFAKKGRWGHKAKPGAVVFFDWQNGSGGGIYGIDHVGLVVEDNGDGTITTVEGNTNNAVEKRVRPKSLVAGYGYPDYDAD
ncbi:CHAP domain-containing protein [Actinomadura sp. NPDC047616]|uniref:CHAP domain-containing protein n=1 Tax=Actinomadura sp. NPDC047616 TaxID=3155914 RepID=UPI0033CA1EC3